MRWKQQFICSK